MTRQINIYRAPVGWQVIFSKCASMLRKESNVSVSCSSATNEIFDENFVSGFIKLDG